MLWIMLPGSLLLILLAAEMFVNALEHLGERLNISEGVTGSLFAAIGTALPETMVPLLAVFAGGGDSHANQEIGTGAILGAPLMLSTLSLSLMSFAVFARRGANGHFKPERGGLARDLNVFLLAFALACAAMFVPHHDNHVRILMSLSMVLIYVGYVLITLRASGRLVKDGHGTEAGTPMLLQRLGVPVNFPTILLQLGMGLALLVSGAEVFIDAVRLAAPLWGISALLLSLLIVPIATELPEKINSILWIRRDKDTLAFGNITGALVFQGTLLPAIGIGLTPWTPQPAVATAIVVTLIATAWLRLCLARGPLRVWQVLVNGLFYLIYLLINF